MTAELCHLDRPCGSCEHIIREGEPVYLVTRAKLPRCAECAKHVGELPEIDLRMVDERIAAMRQRTQQARGVQQESMSERFKRETVADTVRNNIIDYRAKASGEDA
jgi:hypothetical protein